VCLRVSLLTAEGQAGRPAVSWHLCDVAALALLEKCDFTVLLPDPEDVSSSAILKLQYEISKNRVYGYKIPDP
jgi:hypothetical protein